MASLTVENYLKAVLQLSAPQGDHWVTTGRLAAAMQVSPGTVTSMLKTLAESGLAEYRPYEGVRLTPEGHALAMRMLRRHRLIELFLHRTLSLSWDEVHEEAEHMEHAVSDVLINRIDDFLGRPAVDPHGDPIPSADGELRQRPEAVALDSAQPGLRVEVSRVINQDGEFLRYLTGAGLVLGAQFVVTQNSPQAGVLTLQGNAGTLSLGHPAASQIMVTPLG